MAMLTMQTPPAAARSSLRDRRPVLVALSMLILVGACAEEENAPITAAESTTAEEVVEATPTPTPTPAPSRAACEVIAQEKVNALAGVDGQGSPSRSGGADVCTWTSPTAKSVIVQIYPSTAHYERSRTAFEELQKNKSEELADLGDQAFYVGGKVSVMEAATISAQEGNATISVQVMEMNGSASALKAEAIALTREVLAGL